MGYRNRGTVCRQAHRRLRAGRECSRVCYLPRPALLFQRWRFRCDADAIMLARYALLFELGFSLGVTFEQTVPESIFLIRTKNGGRRSPRPALFRVRLSGFARFGGRCSFRSSNRGFYAQASVAKLAEVGSCRVIMEHEIPIFWDTRGRGLPLYLVCHNHRSTMNRARYRNLRTGTMQIRR